MMHGGRRKARNRTISERIMDVLIKEEVVSVCVRGFDPIDTKRQAQLRFLPQYASKNDSCVQTLFLWHYSTLLKILVPGAVFSKNR